VLYALSSATCLNFFFIPPLYTFEIGDSSYWLTLIVMLMTSLLITSYAERLRRQVLVSREKERHTRLLYRLTRTLASVRGSENMARVAAEHIQEAFAAETTIWLADDRGELAPVSGHLPERDYIKEAAVLRWAFGNGKIAGRDTDTMPGAEGLYFPLRFDREPIGVLGIVPVLPLRRFSTQDIASLETLASLLASALERAEAAVRAEKMTVEAEGEKLRNLLLSTVSHDLRTPLASIQGAAGSIALDAARLPRETIAELAGSIHREAERLSRFMTNLLEVTRLESGKARLHLEEHFIDEIIGAAIGRLEDRFKAHGMGAHGAQTHGVQTHGVETHGAQTHRVETRADPALPMLRIDAMLVEQALVNLLENALRHTPPEGRIRVEAEKCERGIRVKVMDDGPGIPSGEETRIFDKFHKGGASAGEGAGLGLAICKAIVVAHGGEIVAWNQRQGGAVFAFTLPLIPPGEATP
jgi:two-component system sensor histidine kinase KdpD